MPDPGAAQPVRGTGEQRTRHDEGEAKWNEALARYHAAEAALEAVAGTEDDDLYDRHLLRFNAALRRLLRTKAPDAAALARKLSLLNAHAAWELSGAELFMPAIEADAHRLS